MLESSGARGWAHLGVLKVLQEANIHIDMIIGASIGALVGGVYARTASATLTQQWTVDRFPTKRQARRRIFDYRLPFRSLMLGHKIFRKQKIASKIDAPWFKGLQQRLPVEGP